MGSARGYSRSRAADPSARPKVIEHNDSNAHQYRLRGRAQSSTKSRALAGSSLGKGIWPRVPDALGCLFDAVRIDDECVSHFLRSARKLREDEDTGVVDILGGYILLSYQVHAVAKRRHHTNPRRAVNVGERTPRGGAIYVVDWHPVEFAQAPVDRAREALQLTKTVFWGTRGLLGKYGDRPHDQHSGSDSFRSTCWLLLLCGC
jgi:hypothetical protein